MASSSLKNNELEFVNSNSETGSISFDNDNKIQLDRTLQSSAGIVASSFAVSGNSSFVSSSSYDDISVDNFKSKNANGDMITITAPTSVTAYTAKVPSSQGSANTFVKNDGSGNLSFSSPYNDFSQFGSTLTSFTNNSTEGEIDISDFLDGNSGNEMLIIIKCSTHTNVGIIYRDLASVIAYNNSSKWIELGKYDSRWVAFRIYTNYKNLLFKTSSNQSLQQVKLFTR